MEIEKLASYSGKRFLDIVVASLILTILSPLILMVWLAVLLCLGKPVLFKQVRPGLHGKAFRLFKFRTMSDKKGKDGRLLPDSERLTRLGRLLRATSLDEIPELMNVLKGDMSLVGPRPLLFRYMPFFKPDERKRFLARPGITGLAQVSGRNLIDWDTRLRLDVMYVSTMSFLGDVKILLKTAWNVIFAKGVSADVDLVETSLDEERTELKSESEFHGPKDYN